jgi:hypothetical protein
VTTSGRDGRSGAPAVDNRSEGGPLQALAQLLRTDRSVECLMEIVDGADHRLIRLAGRLTAAQVPELLHAHAEAALVVHLHLGELVSVDAAGLDVLRRLRRGGTTFLEVPAYIQLKIDAALNRDPSKRP